MNAIGDKIRVLRKNKNITQAQLAEVLSVSSQSVSKWETNLSIPDICLLPIIARYFGVTMDELFDYRLDALNYKERFIRFMVDNGTLRFGNFTFTLQSGRVSPYLIHSGYYRSGSQIKKLGEFYAECIREHFIEANQLIANRSREIPLLIATSITLFSKYGVDTNYCIDYTLETDNRNRREMTLITDTFTSGTTLENTLQQIKEHTGSYPSNIIASVDRMERNDISFLSAKHAIERSYGVNIHSIVTLDDIIRALENGVIAGAEYLNAMKQYREKYIGE